MEHIRKPENHKKFSQDHFSSYLDYLSILNTLLGTLYVQNTIHKVIKENLPLKLEVAFLLLKLKLYLDNKVITFYQFSSNGKRLALGTFWI